MPDTAVRVVDVYPYRDESVNPEFLLLHRAPDTVHAGQWRMVGGKIEDGEAAWETALREVEEETGHAPTQFVQTREFLYTRSGTSFTGEGLLIRGV